MNIYIPSNLRKLKIVDQMYRLIDEYKNYYINDSGPFDDYYYYLKNDPVKRFLNLCIPEDSIKGTDQDYESIINYLSKLFYSVKGTIKVFEYMKKYLNLNFEGDIIYTTRYIEFKLTSNVVSDESTFYKSLEDFLSTLLYFQELNVLVDSVNLVLSGDINNFLGSKIVTYNNFTAIPYEISNKQQ